MRLVKGKTAELMLPTKMVTGNSASMLDGSEIYSSKTRVYCSLNLYNLYPLVLDFRQECGVHGSNTYYLYLFNTYTNIFFWHRPHLLLFDNITVDSYCVGNPIPQTTRGFDKDKGTYLILGFNLTIATMESDGSYVKLRKEHNFNFYLQPYTAQMYNSETNYVIAKSDYDMLNIKKSILEVMRENIK